MKSRSTSQTLKLALLVLAAVLMTDAALRRPAAAASAQLPPPTNQAARNPNAILFKRGATDTRARRDLDCADEDGRPALGAMAIAGRDARPQLRVVQLAGPIKRAWLERLQAAGVEIVGYVPNNAYLIRGTPHALMQTAALDGGAGADDARPIQWMGRLRAAQKLDPTFSDQMLTAQAARDVEIEIELFDSPEAAASIDRIKAIATSVTRVPRRFLHFVVLSVAVSSDRLLEIADFDDLLFINPARTFVTQDERSAQIIAANLTPDGAQPMGPGYRTWLAAKGLNTPADFVLDVTDCGIDRGTALEFAMHPDFLDADGHSRVAYNFNYATDGQIDDRRGHGTLVASVAVGLGASDREDQSGYMLGLGVDPMARVGASRIFDFRGFVDSRLSFTSVASSAYAAGARVSNNSWGTGTNSYDAAAQEYDALARDARPGTPGNQEMVFVFSAGNSGAGGHISSPGTAKNVITVAASENYRPDGLDSCNLDGQGGIGSDGANNALDILRYSAGGPTFDGRAKPDITAPGTHVCGAVSRASSFIGDGLCPGVPFYQPPGQQLYTWSSGTSLAAPHISGAASLIRRFFTTHNLLGDNRPPSPAMTKAFLVNSTSYLTGDNAGGSLPSERQGWGLADLARAFDGTPRKLVDQSVLFTGSGQGYEIEGSLADRSQPLRVALCWTDAPGSLVGAAIVNDLDLEVTVGGLTVYRGNHFEGAVTVSGGEADHLNNVEAVILPASAFPEGVAGNFKITVRAANVAGDGVPGNGNAFDQDFALVAANLGPAVGPPPPPPQKVPVITGVTYVKKRITITGHDFTAAASVEINGKVIDREFNFDAATNSFMLKLKYKKLNLNKTGDSQIVLIENGERSQPFTLHL